jgi:lipopolysaccharide biosynthesis regulator YciM
MEQWKEECIHKQIKLDLNSNSMLNLRAADTFIAYALIAHLEKDDELALEHLKRAFNIDPQNTQAYYIKGLIAYDNGQAEEAVKQWSQYAESAGIFMRTDVKTFLATQRAKKGSVCGQ